MAAGQGGKESVVGDIVRVDQVGLQPRHGAAESGAHEPCRRGEPEQPWSAREESARAAGAGPGRAPAQEVDGDSRRGLALRRIEADDMNVKSSTGEMLRPAPDVDAVGIADEAQPWLVNLAHVTQNGHARLPRG